MKPNFSRSQNNNSINSSTKKTIKDKLIDFETIKKLILSFYSKEDDYFFNLILSPITNTNNFFQGIEQFYKNIKGFSNEDPENKFYGVENFTKIPKHRENLDSIELNKLNTDLIFVLVKEIILSSSEEKIDKKGLIKNKLNVVVI